MPSIEYNLRELSSRPKRVASNPCMLSDAINALKAKSGRIAKTKTTDKRQILKHKRRRQMRKLSSAQFSNMSDLEKEFTSTIQNESFDEASMHHEDASSEGDQTYQSSVFDAAAVDSTKLKNAHPDH